MGKVNASFALVAVVLLLSSCGDGNNSKPAHGVVPPQASQAFSSKTYSTMDRTKEIKIISGTEIELSEKQRNLVGSYTREGNRIRAVFETLGTKESLYFIETEDGLTAEKNNEAYFTEVARKRIETKIEEERHAQIKNMDEDQLAAEKFFASLPKEMSLVLANGVNLEMVKISAGMFTMGSPIDEAARGIHATQHEVTISTPFYMGKYEVTQEQYEAVMGANPSHFKGSKKPVENVTWNDAQDFCRKLSAKTGKIVRLPTEAEWEYACRAGTTTAFYSGDADADLNNAGWHSGNSSRTTHPVGEKMANKFGLYDMHGNVWEWCQDWYGGHSARAQIDPVGPASGATRVCRGGSWSIGPWGCRSAIPSNSVPGERSSFTGFRVVVSHGKSSFKMNTREWPPQQRDGF